MLNVKFFIWAKSCAIDNATNALSVFEVLEELNTPQLPGIMPETKLIALFERNIEKDPVLFDCSLIVKNNDKTIGEQQFQLDFKGLRRNRLVISVPILKIEKEGALTFFLTHKNKEVGHWGVNVIRAS